jgi:hypothetical protein
MFIKRSSDYKNFYSTIKTSFNPEIHAGSVQLYQFSTERIWMTAQYSTSKSGTNYFHRTNGILMKSDDDGLSWDIVLEIENDGIEVNTVTITSIIELNENEVLVSSRLGKGSASNLLIQKISNNIVYEVYKGRIILGATTILPGTFIQKEHQVFFTASILQSGLWSAYFILIESDNLVIKNSFHSSLFQMRSSKVLIDREDNILWAIQKSNSESMDYLIFKSIDSGDNFNYLASFSGEENFYRISNYDWFVSPDGTLVQKAFVKETIEDVVDSLTSKQQCVK